jgi:hypothetical protein
MNWKIGPVTFPAGDAGSAAGFVLAVILVVAAARHIPYVKKLV